MSKSLLPVLLLAILSSCGTRTPESTVNALPENPLEACPDSPNCIRISKAVNDEAEDLFGHVNGAIEEMNGNIESSNLNTLSIHASYGVVFFTDDFNVQITSDSTSGTILHVRSASRVGYSDFGVNGRRVTSFIDLLSENVSFK